MSGLILMPRLGETMEHGTVRAWLVEAGKPFRRGDVIAEIETDKTTVEMPALADGTIVELLAKEGDEVAVGAPLARLAGGPGEADTAPPQGIPVAEAGLLPRPSAPRVSAPPPGRIPASPAARRLAARTGIDLAAIPGSGPNGRRQGSDVRATAQPSAPLHYVERGSGALLPVVFLHGFAGDIDGWINIQNAIALHRRTLALDLPGHGRSVANAAIGFAAMAGEVAATLAAARITRAHLVAHSMGGGVAAALALARPDNVASLTLIAPAGFGARINRQLLAGFADAGSAEAIAPLLRQFFAAGARIPRQLPALIALTRDSAHRAALARALDGVVDPDGTQRPLDSAALAATGIPVRILWGDDDAIVPVSTAGPLPGVFALHRFPGVGHMPHTEVPRETIRLIGETIRGE